jgi:hypothetical protein
MDDRISDELALFSQELHRYLNPHTLKQLAKKVSFVQRASKYQTQDLVTLWLSQKVAATSLTQLCSQLESSTGTSISPGGLNQRFNPAAVQFLQQIFAQFLNEKLNTTVVFTYHYEPFQRIRLLDSTIFQLPDMFVYAY